MKKYILSLVAVVLMTVLAMNVFAQTQKDGDNRQVTQEEFAVEMVKMLQVEHLLPNAALPSDAVDVLTSLGIAPLKGWHPKEFLNQEDYLVVVGKAQGKESVVYRRASQVDEKNIELINEKWLESYEETKKWKPLSKLLKDKKYFPHGAPQSPYGIVYKDSNGDHKVDPVVPSVAKLDEMRKSLTTK